MKLMDVFFFIMLILLFVGDFNTFFLIGRCRRKTFLQIKEHSDGYGKRCGKEEIGRYLTNQVDGLGVQLFLAEQSHLDASDGVVDEVTNHTRYYTSGAII